MKKSSPVKGEEGISAIRPLYIGNVLNGVNSQLIALLCSGCRAWFKAGCFFRCIRITALNVEINYYISLIVLWEKRILSPCVVRDNFMVTFLPPSFMGHKNDFHYCAEVLLFVAVKF